MRWAGHLVRMDASKLAKRAEVEKTSRTQEKATAEVGGLREEGQDKRRSGEDERWREGAADRKLWKERTERVA